MRERVSRQGTNQRSPVRRRKVLRTVGGIVTGAIATTGSAAGQSKPSFGGWFEKTENYDGIVDKTGQSKVTIKVGPSSVSGGPYAFGPAAVRVSPGTSVQWKWSGKGGSHNVVAESGEFKSKLTAKKGHTFSHTFEQKGVYKYVCTPHKTLGMVGAVVVGDVSVSSDSSGGTTPTSEDQAPPKPSDSTGFQMPQTPVGRTLLGFTGGVAIAACLFAFSMVWESFTGPPAAASSWSEATGSPILSTGKRGSRLLPLFKGWIGFLAILIILGLVFVVLWHLVGGGANFAILLGLIVIIAAAYLIRRQ